MCAVAMCLIDWVYIRLASRLLCVLAPNTCNVVVDREL